jgi:hypothetical protein
VPKISTNPLDAKNLNKEIYLNFWHQKVKKIDFFHFLAKDAGSDFGAKK